jgi:protein-L-isoaspartate(D-aspartate) O-methyltransferase
MDPRAYRLEDDEWVEARTRMVARQLEGRGIEDPRVLDAMRRVPRHRFIGPWHQASAYDDCALPIEEGQTISQPYMVALMTQALAIRQPARVLEIGTGSGYQAAILAELAQEVVTIERHPDLAALARKRLASLGYLNVHVIVADGSCGHPDRSPYDGILVTAGAPRIPGSLRSQLADGSRLVIPVGSALHQDLVVVERSGNAYSQTLAGACVFVLLVGREGWPDASSTV